MMIFSHGINKKRLLAAKNKMACLRTNVWENQAGCETSPSYFFQISMKYDGSPSLKTLLHRNYGNMPHSALHLQWNLPGNPVHSLLKQVELMTCSSLSKLLFWRDTLARSYRMIKILVYLYKLYISLQLQEI